MLIKESAIRQLVSQLLLEEVEDKNPAGFNSANASRWEKVCDDAKAEAKNAIDALKGYTTFKTKAALNSTINKIEEFKKIGKGADAYGTAQKAANELGSRAMGEKNNISLALITIASLVSGDKEYKFDDADVFKAAKDLGIKYGDITGPKGLKDDLDAIRSKLDKWLDAFIAMVSYAYNPDDLGDDYVPETPEERHLRVSRYFSSEFPSGEEVPDDTNDSEVVATQTPVSKDSMMIVFKGIIGDSTSGGWKNPATNSALKSYLNASGVIIDGTTIDNIMKNGWAQEGPKIKSLDGKEVSQFSGDMSGLYKFVTEIEAIKRAKSIVDSRTVAESILRRLIREELKHTMLREADPPPAETSSQMAPHDKKSVSSSGTKEIQKIVGVPETGIWDKTLDESIASWIVSKKNDPSRFYIETMTADKLLSGQLANPERNPYSLEDVILLGWSTVAPTIVTVNGRKVGDSKFKPTASDFARFLRDLSVPATKMPTLYLDDDEEDSSAP
jgi:hypothetical protein